MTERVRGRALQDRRDRWFAVNPLCVRCLGKARPILNLAVELDHIVALDNGGPDDETNVQGLCWACHQEKTAEDMGYTKRTRIGLDGWPE